MLENSDLPEKSEGFTLIELMISILLAAVVIGATMAFLFSSVKSNIENIKMTRMNQEMRAAMTFITDELKRSGFTMSSASGASDMIEQLRWNNPCLNYAYQTSSPANAASSAKSFYLSGNVIIYAQDGLCSDGQPINDDSIVSFTSFNAPISYPGFGGVSLAVVTVSLTGQTSHRGNVLSQRTISEVVRLRNEMP